MSEHLHSLLAEQRAMMKKSRTTTQQSSSTRVAGVTVTTKSLAQRAAVSPSISRTLVAKATRTPSPNNATVPVPLPPIPTAAGGATAHPQPPTVMVGSMKTDAAPTPARDTTDELDVDSFIDSLIHYHQRCKKLGKKAGKSPISELHIKQLCKGAIQVFQSRPSLLELGGTPITVVGDLRGQFDDLMAIFDKCGYPDGRHHQVGADSASPMGHPLPTLETLTMLKGEGGSMTVVPQHLVCMDLVEHTSKFLPPAAPTYLFLGNYSGRYTNPGQDMETLCLLLAYTIKCPDNLFMLRGHFDCASMARMYGLYHLCKRRFNIRTFKCIMNCLNHLSLACVVDKKIFCVSGGLSPELKDLDQIRNIVRPTDVPDQGLITDLLWSDPESQVEAWIENDRGVSYTFNEKVVANFLADNDLDLVCRSHQYASDRGYEFFGDKDLVTIFSMTNWEDEKNQGAVMNIHSHVTDPSRESGEEEEQLMCSFTLFPPREVKETKK